MTTPATPSTTSRPPTSVAQREMGPVGPSSADRLAADPAPNHGGRTIDFIDGDHVTLIALGSLHHSGAVAHRLTTLITAGVRHIHIDLRRVGTLEPPTIACLNDIAFHLTDTGGTLELLNAQPAVVAAIASSRDSYRNQEAYA